MDTAGGRGARARRGTRPAAPRSRGAEKGAARSPERDRGEGEGSGGATTHRAPRTDAAPARGGRPARRASAAREQPAGGAASGAEAFLAPRSRAPAGGAASGAEAFLAPRSRAPAGGAASGAEAFLAPRSRAPAGGAASGAEAFLAPRSRAPAGGAASGAEAFLAPRSRAPAARAPAAPRSVAAVPDGAVAAPARRPPPAADALRLRDVLARLSLPREEVSEASTLVNLVVSHLVQAIRSKEGCFSSIERQSSGSYYERVKISEPNEFDIMLVMPVTRIQLDEADDTGAFYYVSFKRIPKEKGWLKFLEEDGKLSAFKMLNALREIIKQEVKNIKDAEVTVARKKAGCPAITLQIKNPPSEISVDIILTLEAQQSWPLSTQDGLKIEQWLGTKVRRDMRFRSVYLVAKQNKSEKVLRGNTWRLSFSHIEKDMIKNHGNSKTCCESDRPKCCRKGCLKLLKYLLEQLKMKYPKELEKFCSYHVKTVFFHSCVTWPNDSDWHLGDLDHCFQQCLGFFVDCLQKSQLTHFFIPQYNLLSLEDKARHHFLSRKICHELNNGFPVFHENY